MMEIKSFFFLSLCWSEIMRSIIFAIPLNSSLLEPTEEELQKASQRIAEYSPDKLLGNPDEMGPYLEGDIRVHISRNGVLSENMRWPDRKIPYEIANTFSKANLALINRAIREYHRVTCIRLVPRTTETNFVHIQSENTGCWSYIGNIRIGKQGINLQNPGCVYFGIILHELMHAAGFAHEQSRMDRDGFIQVVADNVREGYLHNFEKMNSTAFGVAYDYGSVMHYSSTAFSKNGQPTIIALRKPTGVTMGQRRGFSKSDIQKLNCMYGCSKCT